MEDAKDYKDFEVFRQVVTQHKGCKGKIRNSWGIYDAYKLLRKNKWQGVDRPLKEQEFYSIIRQVNNLLAKEIGKGNSVSFPYHMGKLELRKYTPSASFVNGRLKLTYPIDWNKTMRLWFTDEGARAKKTLVRFEEPSVFTVKYNKQHSSYTNMYFYSFAVNNKIKQFLKENIRKGIIETAYNVNKPW